MGSIGTNIDRVKNRMVRWRILRRRDLPAQKPGLFDGMIVQVGDQALVVTAMPENMLMRIDNSSRLRHTSNLNPLMYCTAKTPPFSLERAGLPRVHSALRHGLQAIVEMKLVTGRA